MTKERHILFKVNTDAAEKDFRLTYVWFVSARGCVNGQKANVVTSRDQFTGERIVAQATAAIHLACATCEIKNLHGDQKEAARWKARLE